MNVVEMLDLGNFLNQLGDWLDLGWLKAILSILGMTLGAGLTAALLTLLAGLVFNLAARALGGVQITLTEEALSEVPSVGQLPRGEAHLSGAAAPRGPRLEVISPIQQVFLITKQHTIIGSGADCAIQLSGLALHHAQLSCEEGRYILYDQSEGQVQVQGHAVTGRNMVRDGFEIELGHYRMIFRQ